MNAILICVNGLNTSHLGCYGNTWVKTPHLDRMAAEVFLFDQCFSVYPDPVAARRTMWGGLHSLRQAAPQSPGARPPGLMAWLRSHGVHTVLVRDTLRLVSHEISEADDFAETLNFKHDPGRAGGTAFQAAGDWLERNPPDRPFFQLVDCHGGHPLWSPPAELVERYAGTPVAGLPGHSDALYAATVSHLDQQVGTLLDCIRRNGDWERSLVVLTSLHGVPLGQPCPRPRLCEQLVHVPLLVHLPTRSEPAGRAPALVYSLDLVTTLLEALAVPVPPHVPGRSLLPLMRLQQDKVHEYIYSELVGLERAVRTPNWYFVLPEAPQDGEPQLFIKPEDRWERNDVSRTYPDLVRCFRQMMAGIEDAAASGELTWDRFPSLPSELFHQR